MLGTGLGLLLVDALKLLALITVVTLICIMARILAGVFMGGGGKDGSSV